ncbi:hypothetical protein YC2023_045213 [Brassica napus]
MVGFKSLDRHPPPSPSVHGLLLVSHTQRPLLSSYFNRLLLASSFLYPDVISSWTRSFGLRFMTPLHPPLLPMRLSIRYRQARLRDKENTPRFKLLSSSRTELGW